jgi:hypothetical protein
MKCYWTRLGEHVHTQFYWHSASLGKLVFRWEEFEEFRANCSWITFEMEMPKV